VLVKPLDWSWRISTGKHRSWVSPKAGLDVLGIIRICDACSCSIPDEAVVFLQSTYSFQPHYGRKINTRILLEGKTWPAREADCLILVCEPFV
jgi:hypothetical protein